MANTPEEIRILVADPSKNTYVGMKKEFNELGVEASAQAPKPVHATSVRECQSFLSNRQYAYSAVLVNPALGSPAWVAVIKAANQFRVGTPTIVIYDELPKIKPEEAKKLGIAKFLQRPVTYQQILDLIIKPDEGVDTTPLEESAAAPAPEKKKPAPDKDEDYLAIDLSHIVGNVKSLFDVYVKLASGKYIQVSPAGEYLSAERIEAYKKKGAEQLYITKQAQEEYLNFCDGLVNAMIKDTNVSVEVKTATVSQHGVDAMNFLKTTGFSEASVEQAQKYVANVTEMIQQVSVKSDAVKQWMSNVAAMEHSSACGTVAGLMMKNIGVSTATVFNAMGIACFLHDIGLAGQPEHMFEEDPEKMSAAELEIFYAHASAGAKQLSKMKSVPPIVAEAVEQHHWRLGKTWGGQAKPPESVHLIAEVIGISEDFVRFMRLAKSDPTVDPVARMAEHAPKHFSKKIATAFLKTIQDK